MWGDRCPIRAKDIYDMTGQHFRISDTNGWCNEPTPEEVEADRQAQADAIREIRRRIYGDELIKVYDLRR